MTTMPAARPGSDVPGTVVAAVPKAVTASGPGVPDSAACTTGPAVTSLAVAAATDGIPPTAVAAATRPRAHTVPTRRPVRGTRGDMGGG